MSEFETHPKAIDKVSGIRYNDCRINTESGGGTMIKFFGKNNDLRTEEGKITKTGYAVMILSSVFGLCVFLTGRYFYGKSLQEKQEDV